MKSTISQKIRNKRKRTQRDSVVAFLLTLSTVGLAGCFQAVQNPLPRQPDADPSAAVVYAGAFTASVLNYVAVPGQMFGVKFTYPAAPDQAQTVALQCARDGLPAVLIGTLPRTGPKTFYNFNPGSAYDCKLVVTDTTGALVKNDLDAAFTLKALVASTTAPVYNNVVLAQAFGAAPTNGIVLNDLEKAAQPTIPDAAHTSARIAIKWAVFSAFLGQHTVQDTTSACTGDPAGSKDCYAVFRAPRGKAFDYEASGHCVSTGNTACRVRCQWVSSSLGSATIPNTCIDDDVSYPQQYDYVVTLMRNGVAERYEGNGTGADVAFRTTVMVPPDNMVLVHRDSVNYETCRLAGATADPLNHNRCDYTGFGALPYNLRNGAPRLATVLDDPKAAGKFDFGYHLFVDRWERGCAWTPSSDMVSTIAGGTDTVLKSLLNNRGLAQTDNESGTSTTVGSFSYGYTRRSPAPSDSLEGMVYYDIATRKCVQFRQTGLGGGSQWVDINNPGLTNADYRHMTSNVPLNNFTLADGSSFNWRLPPLVGIKRNVAQKACGATTDPVYGAARLPRRREFNAASAMPWMSDVGEPGALPTAIRKSLTAGAGIGLTPMGTPSALTDLGAYEGCNTNALTLRLIERLKTNDATAGRALFNLTDFADGPAPSSSYPSGMLKSALIDYNPLSPAASSRVANTYVSDINGGLTVIGSQATSRCLSRFGAQDLFGNASEWVADEFDPYQRYDGKRGGFTYGHMLPADDCVEPNDCGGSSGFASFHASNGSSIDDGARDLIRIGTGGAPDLVYGFDGKSGPAIARVGAGMDAASRFANGNYFTDLIGDPTLSGRIGVDFDYDHAGNHFLRDGWQEIASPLHVNSVRNACYVAAGGTLVPLASGLANGNYAPLFYHSLVFGLVGYLNADGSIPASGIAGGLVTYPLNIMATINAPGGFNRPSSTFPFNSPGDFFRIGTPWGYASIANTDGWNNYLCPSGLQDGLVETIYDPTLTQPPGLLSSFDVLAPLLPDTLRTYFDPTSGGNYSVRYGNYVNLGGNHSGNDYGASFSLENHGAGIGLRSYGATSSAFIANGSVAQRMTWHGRARSNVNYSDSAADYNPGKIDPVMGVPLVDQPNFSGEPNIEQIAHIPGASGSIAARLFENNTQIFMLGAGNPAAGGEIRSRSHGMTMGGSAHSLGVYRVNGLRHFSRLGSLESSTGGGTRPLTNLNDSVPFPFYQGYASGNAAPAPVLETAVNGDYATLILPTDAVPTVVDSDMNSVNRGPAPHVATAAYSTDGSPRGGWLPNQLDGPNAPTQLSTTAGTQDYLHPLASDTGFRCVIPVE